VPLYEFLHNLLNVLLPIANKIEVSKKRDATMEILLQDALFPVRREIHSREPRRLTVPHPEYGGDMLLRDQFLQELHSVVLSQKTEFIFKLSCADFPWLMCKCVDVTSC
jgi:hypothetical protein